jgi:hypothetical protein
MFFTAASIRIGKSFAFSPDIASDFGPQASAHSPQPVQSASRISGIHLTATDETSPVAPDSDPSYCFS